MIVGVEVTRLKPARNSDKKIKDSSRRLLQFNNRSEPGSDAAGAGNAPAAHGFNNGKQTRHYKNQPQPPQIIAGDDDARDEAQRAHDAARHTPVAVKVRLEEPVHGKKLAQHLPKTSPLPEKLASDGKLRHIC
jgi:hypothetical protein